MHAYMAHSNGFGVKTNRTTYNRKLNVEMHYVACEQFRRALAMSFILSVMPCNLSNKKEVCVRAHRNPLELFCTFHILMSKPLLNNNVVFDFCW